MKITVCELPHQPAPLASSWAALCAHTTRHGSELVLLPEFAFVEPFWETERFDPARWDEGIAAYERWLDRLPELAAPHVVGTRPVTVAGRRFNEGFRWSAAEGLVPLRRKAYVPAEPGGWEARWFAAGDPHFPSFSAGALSFGLNICTELWALETYGAYARMNVDAVLAPRATAHTTTDKWLAVATVAAVRSGAYCLSSNRVHDDGSCGGIGWIVNPDGRLLAQTSPAAPFATLDLDLATARAAKRTYPRYVFDPGA